MFVTPRQAVHGSAGLPIAARRRSRAVPAGCAGALDAALAQGTPFGGAAKGAPPRRRRPASSAGSWPSRRNSTAGSRARSAPPRPTAARCGCCSALSFVYGVFHAAGPGHGKAVISSYVVANEETWRRGVVLSFASAMLQAAVAVAIVGIAAVLLNATAATMKRTVDVDRDRQLRAHHRASALRLVWVKGRAADRGAATTCRRPKTVGAAATPAHLHDHHHHDHAHHDHAHHDHAHDHASCACTITAITITTTIMRHHDHAHASRP